jgi:hypothetical protein
VSIAILGLLATVLLLAWPLWLFEARNVGRPDNGDAYRVVGGFEARGDRGQVARKFFDVAKSYVPGRSDPAPVALGEHWTTGALVGRGLLWLARATGVREIPASLLAVAYLPLLLAGMVILARGGVAWVPAVAYMVIVADPFNLSWLRSPFEEAATFALIPLWSVMSLRGWARGSRNQFAAWLATSILLGNSKVIWALLVLPMAMAVARCSLERRIAVLLGAAVIAGSALYHSSQYREANGFSRVFFGLCLTENGIAQMPERTLHERSAVLAASPPPDCRGPLAAMGLERYQIWAGRGFWPDAAESIPPAEIELIRERSGLWPFVRVLALDPGRSIRFVLNSWGVAAVTDYRVSHLPLSSASLPWPAWDPSLAFGGLLWVTAVVATLWLARRPGANRAVLAGVCCMLLGAPLAVVAGNGFADFEKHFAPFVHMAAIWLVCLMGGASAVNGSPDRGTGGGA